jgi:endonuclease/exonuclease/phosphatase (EEP) superfamily protein YafD
MRMLVAWALAAACAGWAVLRLLALERGFPLVPLVAYTPFVAAGAVVVVVVAVVLRQRAAALVAAVVALALGAVVAPRALGGPSDPAGDPGPRLRVLTSNLRYGHASAESLVALVRSTRADVLSLQELTPEAVRALDAAGLGEVMPHYVLHAAAGGDGTGLYSRLPLDEAPSPEGTSFTMVAARAHPRGGPVVGLVAVHPSAPVRHGIQFWRRDLRALPAAGGSPLLILAGDFNATLDHAELRRLIDTGYEDAAAQLGAGLTPTWPEGRRIPPPVTIDHVLADERCGFRAVSVHTIPGTDHRAVYAELALPKGART